MNDVPDPVLPPDRGDRGDRGPARELLELVLTTATVEDYLDELVVLTARISPLIAGCGVSLRRAGQVMTVAADNDFAGAVDEVQYDLGQGPCLSALASEEVVAVPDVAGEQRFGDWSSHALAHGVLSSLSVPLRVAGTTVGALNSYSRHAHAFGPEVTAGLVGFAAQAEVALALTLRTAEQSDVVDQLRDAMATRSVIDQALGILMGRQRFGAGEAFAVLRKVSQSRNRKLVDVAGDLVTSVTGKPPEPGRFQT